MLSAGSSSSWASPPAASSSRCSSLPEADRAALIGQLYARGEPLAEVLPDVETDPGDLMRLRLIGALREELGARPRS